MSKYELFQRELVVVANECKEERIGKVNKQ